MERLSLNLKNPEDNETDIVTKNPTDIIFQNHQKKLIWDRKEVSNKESEELIQDEKSTGRMLKFKSDQDRRAVCLRFRCELC